MRETRSMVELRRGDILQADAEALVNTVNCAGYMGRGIALQFRNAYPKNFKFYAAACARKEVQHGRIFVFETGRLGNPRYILNFPTKRHWRGKSRMEDIESGLAALVGEIRRRGIRSVAIPPLGCGLGGLRWAEVRPRIEKATFELPDVQVFLYEPSGDIESRVGAKAADAPRMTPGRAALIGLMRCYLAGLMDPVVSLLEVHKLLYFMQEAGEHLRLGYVKGLYGPYSENLRHPFEGSRATSPRVTAMRRMHRIPRWSCCHVRSMRLTPFSPLIRRRGGGSTGWPISWRGSRRRSDSSSCRRSTGSRRGRAR
jgi:O-acetyl-ADP-ribose deacetylase (regulator of RNase III)